MWLVEEPLDDNEFLPVNLDNIMYIQPNDNEGRVKNNKDQRLQYCIQFSFVSSGNSKWIKWWFDKESDRDCYLEKIHAKLPRLDIGVNDISLENI